MFRGRVVVRHEIARRGADRRMIPTLAARELGRTGLAVCTLGYGGAAIGNLYRDLRDEDANASVQEAFQAGVRYFDTAPFYGFGLSELRLGKALQGAQPPPVISTKVGRRLVPTGPQDARVGREGYFSPRPYAPVFDYGYDAVMSSHAQSLARLCVARVDILLCHDLGRLTHGESHAARLREFLEGGYRAMRELRDAGAVRAIGLGVNETEICVELLESCELDCIMLAGRYTLLEQPALEKLLPLCEQRGVSIICAGPFNSGVLATGSRAGASTHYNYAAPPADVLARVARLEQVCAEFEVPLRAAALQFPLGHPCIASVVAGCADGDEARSCAAMFTHPISPAFWRALRERGLVDPRSPLPA
jgi:D-threo-aldose 1-dehydrogenase